MVVVDTSPVAVAWRSLVLTHQLADGGQLLSKIQISRDESFHSASLGCAIQSRLVVVIVQSAHFHADIL